MDMNKTACVFGGSGFVGRQIVRELAKLGYRIKVASRVPEAAFFLKPYGVVGQVVPVKCSYKDSKDIETLVKGCDVVVNCIGILYQRRRNDFVKAHVDVPGAIAQACKKEKVKRFIHISAMGVKEANSKYAKTKRAGEEAVLKAFPQATILRPSVIFGEDDDFFNMFAKMAVILPFLPLIGGGKTKFQPVYVGDVADAVIKCITPSDSDARAPEGKIYELGGPEVLSFKEVYQRLFSLIQRQPCLLPTPFWMAKVQAVFLGLLPKPLLTCDQVESLKCDSVVSEGALTLKDLGVHPTALDSILPHYLIRYRPGGRFASAEKA